MNTKNKVKLELVGLDGNAYFLMGAFQRAARQQGWTKEEIKVVLDDCMSGDYNHLLSVLMDNTESPEMDEDDDENLEVELDLADDDE
jgi:hypothetical protein